MQAISIVASHTCTADGFLALESGIKHIKKLTARSS